ncbi:MAG: hypothetical protein ABWK00_01195 [Desulfurococcaceae archaeon]
MAEGQALREPTIIVIDVPSKRKRMLSLRVDDDALDTVDRYMRVHGLSSRTHVLSKLVEGFAAALKNASGELKEVRLVLRFEDGDGNQRFREVLLKMEPR